MPEEVSFLLYRYSIFYRKIFLPQLCNKKIQKSLADLAKNFFLCFLVKGLTPNTSCRYLLKNPLSDSFKNKALAIKDLPKFQIERLIPGFEKLSNWKNERIIKNLTAIRGTGRWTVQMLLIFH